MKRQTLVYVLIYGICGGILIAFLKFIEYRFIIIEHSIEIYGGLTAILFAGVGIWLGLKLTRKQEVVVIKEVPVPAQQQFTVNEVKQRDLGITKRELEILSLIAQGLSNREIAEKLFVSENTIKTQGGVLAPAKLAETNEQLEREKREYQRKQEDLEADGNRAKDQLLGPIREKLTKFVEAYTEKRGITVLIDLANAIQSNTLVWYDPRADVTQDFVNEYNKANPVPTGAAPAPQKPG